MGEIYSKTDHSQNPGGTRQPAQSLHGRTPVYPTVPNVPHSAYSVGAGINSVTRPTATTSSGGAKYDPYRRDAGGGQHGPSNPTPTPQSVPDPHLIYSRNPASVVTPQQFKAETLVPLTQTSSGVVGGSNSYLTTVASGVHRVGNPTLQVQAPLHVSQAPAQPPPCSISSVASGIPQQSYLNHAQKRPQLNPNKRHRLDFGGQLHPQASSLRDAHDNKGYGSVSSIGSQLSGSDVNSRYPPNSQPPPPRESAYHPQVEAISPALEDVRVDPNLLKEKNEVADTLSRMEREITNTDKQLKNLRTKQAQLESRINQQGQDQLETSDDEDLLEERRFHNPFEKVNADNRQRAKGAAKYLEHHLKTWRPDPSLSIPLYHQPSDIPRVHDERKRYKQFKPRLIEWLSRRQAAERKRLMYLSNQYDKLSRNWVKKQEKFLNSHKRRNKEIKWRECFEKNFPDVKKNREEYERWKQEGFEMNDEYASNAFLVYHDVDKMKDYAIDPPITLPPWRRRYKYMDKNGIVRDPLQQHKAAQDLTLKWTPQERAIFKDRYVNFPKNFNAIASYLEKKTVADCIQFYYLTKKSENYKQLVKRHHSKRRRVQQERQLQRQQQQPPAQPQPTQPPPTTNTAMKQEKNDLIDASSSCAAEALKGGVNKREPDQDDDGSGAAGGGGGGGNNGTKSFSHGNSSSDNNTGNSFKIKSSPSSNSDRVDLETTTTTPAVEPEVRVSDPPRHEVVEVKTEVETTPPVVNVDLVEPAVVKTPTRSIPTEYPETDRRPRERKPSDNSAVCRKSPEKPAVSHADRNTISDLIQNAIENNLTMDTWMPSNYLERMSPKRHDNDLHHPSIKDIATSSVDRLGLPTMPPISALKQPSNIIKDVYEKSPKWYPQPSPVTGPPPPVLLRPDFPPGMPKLPNFVHSQVSNPNRQMAMPNPSLHPALHSSPLRVDTGQDVTDGASIIPRHSPGGMNASRPSPQTSGGTSFMSPVGWSSSPVSQTELADSAYRLRNAAGVPSYPSFPTQCLSPQMQAEHGLFNRSVLIGDFPPKPTGMVGKMAPQRPVTRLQSEYYVGRSLDHSLLPQPQPMKPLPTSSPQRPLLCPQRPGPAVMSLAQPTPTHLSALSSPHKQPMGLARPPLGPLDPALQEAIKQASFNAQAEMRYQMEVEPFLFRDRSDSERTRTSSEASQIYDLIKRRPRGSVMPALAGGLRQPVNGATNPGMLRTHEQAQMPPPTGVPQRSSSFSRKPEGVPSTMPTSVSASLPVPTQSPVAEPAPEPTPAISAPSLPPRPVEEAAPPSEAETTSSNKVANNNGEKPITAASLIDAIIVSQISQPEGGTDEKGEGEGNAEPQHDSESATPAINSPAASMAMNPSVPPKKASTIRPMQITLVDRINQVIAEDYGNSNVNMKNISPQSAVKPVHSSDAPISSNSDELRSLRHPLDQIGLSVTEDSSLQQMHHQSSERSQTPSRSHLGDVHNHHEDGNTEQRGQPTSEAKSDYLDKNLNAEKESATTPDESEVTYMVHKRRKVYDQVQRSNQKRNFDAMSKGSAMNPPRQTPKQETDSANTEKTHVESQDKYRKLDNDTKEPEFIAPCSSTATPVSENEEKVRTNTLSTMNLLHHALSNKQPLSLVEPIELGDKGYRKRSNSDFGQINQAVRQSDYERLRETTQRIAIVTKATSAIGGFSSNKSNNRLFTASTFFKNHLDPKIDLALEHDDLVSTSAFNDQASMKKPFGSLIVTSGGNNNDTSVPTTSAESINKRRAPEPVKSHQSTVWRPPKKRFSPDNAWSTTFDSSIPPLEDTVDSFLDCEEKTCVGRQSETANISDESESPSKFSVRRTSSDHASDQASVGSCSSQDLEALSYASEEGALQIDLDVEAAGVTNVNRSVPPPLTAINAPARAAAGFGDK